MVKPVAVYLKVVELTSASLVHEVRHTPRYSMTYAVIGFPPSFSGGFHSKSALLSVTPLSFNGPTGLDGGPSTKY